MKNKKIFYCEIYFVKLVSCVCVFSSVLVILIKYQHILAWIFTMSIMFGLLVLFILALIDLYFFSAVLIGLNSKLCPWMIIDLENKKIKKYGWFLQKREEFDLVDIKGVGYIHRKFMNGLYISYKDVNSNLRKKIMRGDASISDYVLTIDYTKGIEKYFIYIAAQNGVKFDDIYQTPPLPTVIERKLPQSLKEMYC